MKPIWKPSESVPVRSRRGPPLTNSPAQSFTRNCGAAPVPAAIPGEAARLETAGVRVDYCLFRIPLLNARERALATILRRIGQRRTTRPETAMANKTELLRFLDSHVFNPILRAKEEDYKESDRTVLADVQGSTKSEKERFHHYGSAQEVRDNYLSDLHSETARRINKELRRLKLPRLPDVKDEFLKIAGDEKSGRKKSGAKTKTAGG
jgi:hypothetical protein